jgi:hypothetical protein
VDPFWLPVDWSDQIMIVRRLLIHWFGMRHRVMEPWIIGKQRRKRGVAHLHLGAEALDEDDEKNVVLSPPNDSCVQHRKYYDKGVAHLHLGAEALDEDDEEDVVLGRHHDVHQPVPRTHALKVLQNKNDAWTLRDQVVCSSVQDSYGQLDPSVSVTGVYMCKGAFAVVTVHHMPMCHYPGSRIGNMKT